MAPSAPSSKNFWASGLSSLTCLVQDDALVVVVIAAGKREDGAIYEAAAGRMPKPAALTPLKLALVPSPKGKKV
jgi:hypothetical protein